MPATGRKNRLGSLHGPYTHEWLNPCHPAMLAALRGCNVDVQVPYRLPFRCSDCHGPTPQALREILLATQRAQDAQTGYCADYCSKNQPMAFHEIKEFQKGHARLHMQLTQSPASANIAAIGRRHAIRILNDSYCKGIVCGQVESVNLRANHSEHQIVHSERFSTTRFQEFHGRNFLQAVTSACPQEDRTAVPTLWKRQAGPRARHLRACDLGRAYGMRPKGTLVWPLSPYEFVTYWELKPLRAPHTWAEWLQEPQSSWQVTLTDSGVKKLATSQETGTPAHLKPWEDCLLKPWDQSGVIFFDDAAATRFLRHAWYIQRRPTPVCPVFANSPVPLHLSEDLDRSALLATAYFRAWTLHRHACDSTVPHVAHLKGASASWDDSFRQWLLQLPCEETKRYINNFLSVYRVRSTENGLDNSDDSGADEPLVVDASNIQKALATQLPRDRAERTSTLLAPDNHLHSALSQADALWSSAATYSTAARNDYAACEVKAMLRATRSTARPPLRPFTAQMGPSLRALPAENIPARIQAWLADLAAETKPQTKRRCNSEQFLFLQRAAARVTEELRTEEHSERAAIASSQPMRWALHGGPGTGKSYVVRLLRTELFEQILGWTHGIEFKVLTLQAVMADQVQGDAIHHGVGLNSRNDNAISLSRLLDLLSDATRWRWLVIDEISMVSAELLARLELRCRELVRDACPSKYAQNSADARPFGGLNVVLVGDWWQLEPPKGTFLANLPLQWLSAGVSKKRPHAAHGQALLWGQSGESIQGVTQLVECERTHDRWLQAVQEEFRACQLTETTHAFLHGKPTAVPGSWTQGAVECGNAACAKLAADGVPPRLILQTECAICRRDRASRARVAGDPADPRFSTEFAGATCIFSTNALKCHVNKLRAHQFAAAHGQALLYAVATDRISTKALSAKPDLAKEKLFWLQRHDKECGNLYGILPLCVGLPVVATEHIDRRRKILRGCRGTVVGWAAVPSATIATGTGAQIWPELPAAIYVRFETESAWQLDDNLLPNVYPVAPLRSTWHLDGGRPNPQLSISRRQFPLAPAFASTAHAAQGQTLCRGVIADLLIGPNGNPFTAYVALTRVLDRWGLLIFRPFDPRPFQKGVPLGREMLLRVWQQEHIDWESIRAKYLEERPCAECRERKNNKAYSAGQWKRPDDARVCKECVWQHVQNNCPWQCAVCRHWGPKDAFAGQAQSNPARTSTRICATCERRKPCARCKRMLTEDFFGKAAWKARHADRRLCQDCARKMRSAWTCSACCERKPLDAYSVHNRRHPSRSHGHQVCNACVQRLALKRVAVAANVRLARLRQNVACADRARLMAAIREEINAIVGARQAAQKQSPELASPAMPLESPAASWPQPSGSSHLQPSPSARTVEYICPHCSGLVASRIRDGLVDHRHVCGQQFRVACGEVRSKSFPHTCPTCGTVVTSKKQTGRIQCRHKRPDGRACPRSEWRSK